MSERKKQENPERRERSRPAEQENEEEIVLLEDLVPKTDVTGGRTVFGGEVRERKNS